MNRMMYKPSLTVIMFLISNLFFTTCKEDEDPENNLTDITGKTWTLSYIENTKTHTIVFYPDISENITIEFANKQIQFDGICNTGTGSFSAQEKTLVISNLVITDIYCDNLDWESITGTNLRSATRYDLLGNKLIIYSQADFNLIFQ